MLNCPGCLGLTGLFILSFRPLGFRNIRRPT
jgi:hypothetical protein